MLATSTRIGHRYVIDRLLGQGGMSNLYIAKDLTEGGAIRVIKEMTARYADPKEQQQAEELFMREAQLLATLNHPHIPKVYDKFRFQGKYYLSMEYCPGEDLGKLISDRGTIEEKWVAAWGAQMATVLYYLHRQNPPIVFRDVKPSNIMIVNEQVKLIDFGIARLFTNAKKGDTMRIGSPGYAPPEQYSGQTDPRSDIYALGVTLHHAVTGSDPTVSQTPFILPAARTINPHVSLEMEQVIQRATQLDPDKRYENCLDLKRDLQVVMRNHGMMVGASMPLTTAVQTPQPTPTATTPPAPTQPSPTASPPINPPPNAGSAPASPQKSRPSLAPLFLMGFAAIMGILAFKAPETWKNKASEQLHRAFSQILTLLPGTSVPLSDAERILLHAPDPLPALEELGKSVRAGKSSAEETLLYQNALVYGSGRPCKRFVVVAPKATAAVKTAALWQRTQWDQSSESGALSVVSVISVEDDWPAALRRATSSEIFRKQESADALVILPPAQRPSGWAKWFDPKFKVFVAGSLDSSDPHQEKPLPGTPPNHAKVLQNLQLNDLIWLAQVPPPPASIKAQSLAGPTAVADLLKVNPKAMWVIDEQQLKESQSWPKIAGIRLLIWYPAGSLPNTPPELPPQLKLYALTQASAYNSDLTVTNFFNQEGLDASLYDQLSWAGAQIMVETRQTGLTWHTNREGEWEPARWQLLEAKSGSWCWLREGSEK